MWCLHGSHLTEWAIKAEQVCWLVLPGVRTSLSVEEAIVCMILGRGFGPGHGCSDRVLERGQEVPDHQVLPIDGALYPQAFLFAL